MEAGCDVTNCCRQLFAPAGVLNTAGSCFVGPLPDYCVERACRVRNLPLLSFRSLGIFRSLHDACTNYNLVRNIGRNISDSLHAYCSVHG